jgi:uncharacterized protein YndB with AHSA1/START domain
LPTGVKSDPGAERAARELIIERIFDAPRTLVFEAFTDPHHLMKWWGPHGCAVISCTADLRAGGTWCISMRSPRVLPQFINRHPVAPESGPAASHQRPSDRYVATGEHEMVEGQRGVYQEVVKPERLVFTYAFEDDRGRPLHQTVVTVSFADEGGKTKLTLHQAIFETVSVRDDHVRGWSEALEHLSEYLMRAG